MIFKTLTVNNFMSIKSMKIDLDNQGLVLINGINLDNPSARSNGAGKSSIIESLVYAVYGKTIRGIKADAVVNKNVGKNMKIFLDIVDDDGSEYRIARYRKHRVNKNSSKLYKNGVDITPKSEADFNNAVADLLQADYLTFTSSLLYSAESFKFTSSTDAEMKSTFDMMLGLETFTKCLEIARNSKKSIEGEISNITYKIDTIQEKLSRIAEEIEDNCTKEKEFEEEHKERISELQSDADEIGIEIDKLNDDAVSINKSIKKAEKAVESAKNKVESAKEDMSQIDELKEAISDTKSSIKSIENEIKSKKGIMEYHEETIEKENKNIEKFNAKIKKFLRDKEKLDDGIGQPCPTCGQPLTKECLMPAKMEYDEKISQEQENIDNKQGFIDRTNADIEKIKGEIQESSEELEQLKSDLSAFNEALELADDIVSAYDYAQEQYDDARDKLTSVKSDLKVVDSKIKTKVDEHNRMLRLVETERKKTNPYSDIIKKLKEEQKEYGDNIVEMKDSISGKLEEKSILEFWEKAYSNQGIKSFILDDITPFLNKRVNKYLEKLASNHIEVVFSTQSKTKSGELREKFSIEINNADGGKEYISNSSGERRRIDIAVNLALQDLVASRSNKKINIAIFDEAFDTLDDIGTEHVIEVLQELSNEKSSIFVISHNEHLKSYFSNILTVIKKNGCSSIGTSSDYDDGEEDD